MWGGEFVNVMSDSQVIQSLGPEQNQTRINPDFRIPSDWSKVNSRRPIQRERRNMSSLLLVKERFIFTES